MQINNEPKRPREMNKSISAGLEQIILAAMKKNPAERFQTAEAMQKALAKLRADPAYVFPDVAKLVAAPKKKGISMTPVILGVASALLLTIIVSGVYLISALFFSNTAAKSEEIRIPALVGEVLTTELQTELEEYKYKLNITRVYDENTPDGTIISQSPEEGATRKVIRGTKRAELNLSVSMGAEILLLENYAMMEYRSAEDLLRQRGFKVSTEHEFSDTVIIDYVTKTLPKAGSKVTPGETITLYVSKGEQIVTTIVPDFVGEYESVAYRMLIESNLGLGEVIYERSDLPSGTVISQSKVAGDSVPVKATKIDFVISGGASYGITATTPPQTSPAFPWMTQPTTRETDE
jgi:serine/threonine-protein kinase